MALILTQRPGDSVYITTPEGEEIVVTVRGVKGSQVTISYDADRSITIDRAEIHDRKQMGVQGA